jgi:hypothetical protein
MIADIVAASVSAKRDRTKLRAALDDLFRAGKPPTHPLGGRYSGSLVLVDIAPGLTHLVETIASLWLPWQGKTFDALRTSGDNIFTRDSLPLAWLFNPLYRGITEDGPNMYRAFTFITYVAPGLFDPDRQVFKIDYDLPDNPPLTIRRVLDEIVQLKDGVYLGKAHIKWWWGRWQTVAYFALEGDRRPQPGA